MSFLRWKIAALLLCIPCLSSEAHALEDGMWVNAETHPWEVGDLAVARRVRTSRIRYSLSRTQTWANGLAASSMPAFTPSNFDRTVGAKMQPFQDWNFLVGTEVTRSGGQSSFLSSRAMWESFWTQDVQWLGGLKVGLSTTGSMDNAQTDYLQSFSGSLNVPLDLSLNTWSMELRVSPHMSVDASNGALNSSLMSEIMGQKVLSSQTAAFRSTLNLSVGYSLAPDTRPAASARLELRISPNL
jgi:hypothetical protein